MNIENVHMRTTITIPEDLLKEVMRVSEKKGYSEAIVTSLRDYISLKRRLEFLDYLYKNKPPFTMKDIKKRRNKDIGWALGMPS